MCGRRAALLLSALLLLGCGARSGVTSPAEEAQDAGAGPADAGERPDPPPVETCNGRDDDGDGEVDETCDCAFAEARPCEAPAPDDAAVLCARGTERCVSGRWRECEGTVWCDPVEDRFVYEDLVDVVLVVDQSESMDDHIDRAREGVDVLALQLAASGRLHRLHLLASTRGPHAICPASPVGGPGCSEGELLHRIDQEVHSGDALFLFDFHLEEIEGAMAPGSQRVIVVLSEDDSTSDAFEFHAAMAARPGWRDYAFFGVVGTHYSDCRIADPSYMYPIIANSSGGRIYDICLSQWIAPEGGIADRVQARPRALVLSRPPFAPPQVLAGEPPAELDPALFDFDPERPAVVIEPGALARGTPVVVRYLTPRR